MELGILRMEIRDYIKISKQIHEVIRKTGINSKLRIMTIEERVANQYLQDLASRATYTTDWYDDVKERTEQGWPKLAFDGQKMSPIEFIRRRHKNLMQLYRDMGVQDIQPDTLHQKMMRREQFVKAGSSLSSTSKVTDIDMKQVKVRLDKRQAVQWMSAEDISLSSHRLPAMFLAGINKMENGKCRLLLTTDTIHYLMGEYLLQPIEQRLDRKINVDEPKDPIDKLNFKMQMAEKCKQNVFFQSFDWDNFNIQHTIHDMQDVWFSLKQVIYEDIFKKNQRIGFEQLAIKDYMRVCEWYALSMNNMWLKSLPDNKILEQLIKEQPVNITQNYYIEKPPSEKMDEHDAKRAGLMNRTTQNALLLTQGLASGRRDTNHTNTILNVAQANQVMQDTQQIFHEIKDMFGERLHKGDDIALELKNEMVGILMLVMMRVCGQNGQGSKLIMGDGEFEFLRQFYGNDGVIRGYLRRSIPNMVSTDYQGEEVDKNDPEQLISALIGQVQKLKIRGMNSLLCDCIEDQVLRTWSKPRKYSQIQVGVNQQRLNASVIDGGLGLSIRGKLPRRAIVKGRNLTVVDQQRKQLLQSIKQTRIQIDGIVGQKKAALEYYMDIRSTMPINQQVDTKLGERILTVLGEQDAVNSLTKLQKEHLNMIRKRDVELQQLMNTYKLKEGNPLNDIQAMNTGNDHRLQSIRQLAKNVKQMCEQNVNLYVEPSVMLNLQKQIARIDIKKREVLQLMYDQFYKDDDGYIVKKYGNTFNDYKLEIFITELDIDPQKRHDILLSIREARKYYTDRAIYCIVFKNVSFDQVMTLDIHEDIRQYYRQYSLLKAEQWLNALRQKITIPALQEKVRIIEMRLVIEHNQYVNQKEKFRY